MLRSPTNIPYETRGYENVLPSKLGLSINRFISEGLDEYLFLLRNDPNEETNFKIPFIKQAVSGQCSWTNLVFTCSDGPPISLLTCQLFSLEIIWLENAPLNDIEYPDLYGSAHKYSSSPAPFRESLYCSRPPEAASTGSTGDPARWVGPPTLCPHCSVHHRTPSGGLPGRRGAGGLILGASQLRPHLPASISSAHTSKLEATALWRSLRPLTSQRMDTSPMCMTQSN